MRFHQRLLLLLVFCGAALASSGCTTAVVAGAAAAGGYIAHEKGYRLRNPVTRDAGAQSSSDGN